VITLPEIELTVREKIMALSTRNAFVIGAQMFDSRVK